MGISRNKLLLYLYNFVPLVKQYSEKRRPGVRQIITSMDRNPAWGLLSLANAK